MKFFVQPGMALLFAAVALAPASAQMAKRADFKDGKVGVEMVFVKGGAFKMGCTGEQKECEDNEKPAHNVTVGDFYIGKYEVTQKQWFKIMGDIPASPDFKGDNYPVTNFGWDDIQEFLSRLNKMTGKSYRLPTEAEWEFAARGGTKSKGYVFAGSDNPDDVAWHKGNSGEAELCLDGMSPVGTKAPNELGLYDMSGNAWEWVSDWYGDYSSFDAVDPKGPPSGSYRVSRGGGYYYAADGCRVSTRFLNSGPDYGMGALGLRLALSP
jgi:formylglycine-generating enzyme required for sulfatase activity